MGAFDRPGAGSRRFSGRSLSRVLVVASIAALALAAVTSVASADAGKTALVHFSQTSFAAGSSTPFTVQLTNESTQQQLGSANLTPPSGFTVSVPSPTNQISVVNNVVQLRNLGIAPGASSPAFSLVLTAPCLAAAPLTWQATAKQSNNYSGPPGNNVGIDPASNLGVTLTGGGCKLHFFTEPADAAVNTVITSTPFNSPAGTSVQVEVLDGSNHRVTSSTAPISVAINTGTTGAKLTGDNNQTGTITKNAVAGVASFSSLAIDTHGNYNLIATSPGLTSAISNASEPDLVFTIWDSAQACTANKSCSTTVGNTSTFTSTFSGTSTTGGSYLLLTLGQDDLSCGDTYNHAPSTTTGATYHFAANGTKQLIGDIDKSVVQQQPNNGAAFYRVCFESDDTTFTYPGGVVKPAGTPFILPACKDVAGTPPCVQSITKTNAGDVIETITLPPDDAFRYR